MVSENFKIYTLSVGVSTHFWGDKNGISAMYMWMYNSIYNCTLRFQQH